MWMSGEEICCEENTDFKQYREKENGRIRKWCSEHPEEKKLIARNWNYRHPEQHKEILYSWRRRNPEKVRLQNVRARRNIRRKKARRMYWKGIYPPILWDVECPRCNIVLKTRAKRPRCEHCGYTFPRRYMEHFIDNQMTTPCVCCKREIPYQDERTLRKYCDSCFPQIVALKYVLEQMRSGKKDLKEWYRGTTEIVVAVTCVFCGDIIIGRSGKRICDECLNKWERSMPKHVMDYLTRHSTMNLPKDFLIWYRIFRLRHQGIYNLKQL
jgi:hypothetical protein